MTEEPAFPRVLRVIVTAVVGLGLGAIVGGLLTWDAPDRLPGPAETTAIAAVAYPGTPVSAPPAGPSVVTDDDIALPGVLAVLGDDTRVNEITVVAGETLTYDDFHRIGDARDRLIADGWRLDDEFGVWVDLARGPLRLHLVDDGYLPAKLTLSAHPGTRHLGGVLIGAPLGAAATLWLGRRWRRLDGDGTRAFHLRSIAMAFLLPGAVAVLGALAVDAAAPLWRVARFWPAGLGLLGDVAVVLLVLSLVGGKRLDPTGPWDETGQLKA